FWRIALRPGKPLMAGRNGNALFLGLPGNPVSAFVTATLFLLPLVRHMSGAADPLPPLFEARLANDMPAASNRAVYLRGMVENGTARPLTDQDSAGLGSLAAANALIVRPSNAPAAKAGEMVHCLPIA
ncbi:MAG TPA: molybdopterin molybdenumtransferase MoeA, partial [Rhizorhapis sp.]|nr:molybdopterin molybdenumtransferase MoeA [Rhizorhapis sp.]